MIKNHLSDSSDSLETQRQDAATSRPDWAKARILFSLLAGALVLSIGGLLVLGGSAFDRSLMLQLGLVLGLFLVLILFHRLQIGLMLLLFGGIIVSKELGTGTQTSLNAAFLLSPVIIGIWLIHLMYGQKKYFFVSYRTILPLFCFMITAIIAFVVGQYPWFPAEPASISAQLAQLAIFLFSCGLFLTAAHQLQAPTWLEKITFIFIGLGSIHLLFRLPLGPISSLSRFLPQSVTMGSMFWTWLVTLSVGQALVNKDLHPFKRLVLAVIGITAIVISVTQLQTWVSGWAPALLAVFIILAIRFPIPVLIATPALVLAAILSASYATDFAASGDNLYSLQTRLAAIKALMPILQENPLLGLGPANYYHYTALFPIDSWYVEFNSHNTYIDLIAQTGLVGLFSFLWFAWKVLRTSWDLRFQSMSGFEYAFTVSVSAGLAATLVAGALGDWILPFVYNTGLPGYRTSIIPWIFMGGLVALEQRKLKQL